MNILSGDSRTRGFTLIELMIVLAIIAILVAMAVPAYHDYTIRSKVGECINGAAIAKVQISEFRQTLGSWPTSMEDAGLENSGLSHFCDGFSDYDAATGAFTVDIDEAAIDALIASSSLEPVLTPSITASNNVNWSCSRGNTQISDLKYLPATCRSGTP